MRSLGRGYLSGIESKKNVLALVLVIAALLVFALALAIVAEI